MAALSPTEADPAIRQFFSHADTDQIGSPSTKQQGWWDFEVSTRSFALTEPLGPLEKYVGFPPSYGVIFEEGNNSEVSAMVWLNEKVELVEHVSQVIFGPHSLYVRSQKPDEVTFAELSIVPNAKVLQGGHIHRLGMRPSILPIVD